MFEYLINTWWFIPILIFFARIIDVSIGTIRLIFISKGLKYYAPILGFFEVLIWLLAVKKVMTDADTSFFTMICYCGGFATGTYLGMVIEENVVSGKSIIRVMSKSHFELLDKLNEMNQKYTLIDATSESGPIKVIYLIVSKQNVPKILETIKATIPNAYYSMEDIKYVKDQKIINPAPTNFKAIFEKINVFNFRKGK
jgi:uncharacterized protein YebE (UPF0316 family)